MAAIFLRGFIEKLKFYCQKYPAVKSKMKMVLSEADQFPTTGKALGKDCYKIRLVLKQNDTSPGSRFIICTKYDANSAYFITIYDKAEYENVSDDDLKMFIDYLLRHSSEN